MVVTMLEAEVPEGNAERLVDSFKAGGGSLPPPIRETFLLRESGGDLWRIVTVWESAEALDGYRASVDTPGGVLMFRSAGADPTLTIFEVAAHADHT
jgi:heme-degrading monooxygenase HmoA